MTAKKEKGNNIIWIVLILNLIFSIVFPLVVWRRYNVCSSDWYNFLGGFVGGAIGGIATLIAIVISTNQTRKVQKENYEFEQNNIRKKFADEIATEVSTYISEIKLYYDMMESKYRYKEESNDSREVNRSISVQKAFLLRIKLKNICLGKEILKHINNIEKNYVNYVDKWDDKGMEKQITELKNATVEFIDKY